ncbi:hypothetical protein ACPB8Q_06475 [Methanocaldococcus indicus]|uniref:hypothetical protein n=1 Tax=Methanocaldococcus indicus TaxID=213231 RepID=UPI003C6CEDB0
MSRGYHIQHNAKPSIIREFIEYSPNAKKSELKEVFLNIKPSIIDDNYTIMNKLINREDKNEIENLLKMDEVIFNNYLHYKLYSSSLPIGWSYRSVIHILFEEYKDKKINYNDIEQKVKDKAFNEGLGSISFSSNSVRGAINFIKSLYPSPIDENNIFNLRDYCQPHLLLWGVDYLYKKQWGEEYGSLMLLDSEKIEELCKFCLIDEDVLDNHLKELGFMYDFVEISIKAFGKYIRLKRAWSFNDIL